MYKKIQVSLMYSKFISAGAFLMLAIALHASGAGQVPIRTESLEPVRIAVVLAMTGIAAEENSHAIPAAELAKEEINRSGGIHGHPVQLEFFDTQSTPLGAKKAAHLAVEAGVLGVVGPFRSSHALPAAAVLQQAGVPMITPIATNPRVTRTGDHIFRICINDEFQGLVMARFAYDTLRARTAVVLMNITEDYSITLAEMFTRAFIEAGGELVRKDTYKGGSVDFADLLEQVRDNTADVVFIPGYSRDSGLLMLQAANMGIRSVFLGGDGWGEKMRKYAGDALSGSYYTTHWHPDVPYPESRTLQQLYRERFGLDIKRVIVPLTYDAVLLFADAARRAERPDRESIRKALAATEQFQGATGAISFDENGDPRDRKAVVLKFEKDSTILIESLSHPN